MINERFIWAHTILDVKPTDHLLEIGCGTGVLAELIAKSLTTGKILGVDKSASMIKMATKRNHFYIETGHASFIASEFAKADVVVAAYDKVLAFNVNSFWKNPSIELGIIRKSLTPAGCLYIFYQAPYEIDLKVADPVIGHLETNAFEVNGVILKKLKPVSALCIQAKPA